MVAKWTVAMHSGQPKGDGAQPSYYTSAYGPGRGTGYDRPPRAHQRCVASIGAQYGMAALAHERLRMAHRSRHGKTEYLLGRFKTPTKSNWCSGLGVACICWPQKLGWSRLVPSKCDYYKFSIVCVVQNFELRCWRSGFVSHLHVAWCHHNGISRTTVQVSSACCARFETVTHGEIRVLRHKRPGRSTIVYCCWLRPFCRLGRAATSVKLGIDVR